MLYDKEDKGEIDLRRTYCGSIDEVVFDKNENYIVFMCEHGYVYDWIEVRFIRPGFKKLERE